MHGAVPKAKRGVNVGLGHPAEHLGIGQNALGQPVRLAHLGEVGKGIDQYPAALFEERVKVGDGMDFGLTVSEGQGFAALVAMPAPIFIVIL